MLGHDHMGGVEAVRGETVGDHLMGMHIPLGQPQEPTQGYIPLGGMGMGWVMDTWGFTPVLPYMYHSLPCSTQPTCLCSFQFPKV